MKARLFALPVLLAALAAGCTMIPEYERPEAPVAEDWPAGPAYAKSDAAAGAAGGPGAEGAEPAAPLAADLPWESFFTDQRLQAVIATALENNRDLRAAILTVDLARALYRIQRAELLPVVDATADARRERIAEDFSTSDDGTTFTRYSAGVGIASWEIDLFGFLRSLSAAALEQYFATMQARRAAQILLVSEVAAAYLALAADRENFALAQATLATQQAALDLIARRHEVGITSELDVFQARTRVETARVDLARYTELIAQDRNALDLLAGAPVPEEMLPATLHEVAPLGAISAGTPSEVLLARPDILQAESLLKSVNANIGAARAALFPRITLTTAVGTASSELSGLFESGSFIWHVAPQATLPIFDPRAWSALDATHVEREIAVARYQGAIQAAFREVADALARQGTLGDQTEAQQALVAATEAAYRLSNARYETGADIYLNVLDAQRSLYAAQQGLIEVRLAGLANQVRLYAVLGGGAGPDAAEQAAAE